MSFSIMGLVTDYVLPDGAVLLTPCKWGVSTNIRLQCGKLAQYKPYTVWRDMMRRAHHHAKGRASTKNYIDCSVSEEFQHFGKFYDWAKRQTGFNKIDLNGFIFTLDKDILSTARGYFPDTTVFVPEVINNFFKIGKLTGSKFLRGVCQKYSGARFAASINRRNRGNMYLGTFDTELEAHLCWCEAKNEYGRELGLLYKDYIDPRVYERLINFDAFQEFN